MKMMKRLVLAVLLAFSLAFLLSACQGADGKDGVDGKDGLTPTVEISEDGYWVINGEKSDVKAKGEKGDKGEDGSSTNENPQGLAFYLKDDGTYVAEIGYAKYLSKIEIPATYNGKAVTEVRGFGGTSGASANTTLEEIVIPNGITTIGGAAFEYCTALTSVTIPDSVTSIGNGAFYNCRSLTSIEIPDSVTSIGSSAFRDCESLTSVVIGNGVTSIGGSAFSSCESLTSVVFENPTGWKHNGSAVSEATLSDPTSAANYLKNGYTLTRE